jgi:hypothetical protein
LPSNTSWRFIPVGHAFTDPGNPFQNGFPELLVVNNLQLNNLPMHDFRAVKVGDVNGNANPDIANIVPEDRNGPSLFFDLDDQTLEAGTNVQVRVRAAAAISGFQMTLNYPGLELIDLEPGAGLTAENFAVFNAEHSMTASWEAGGQPEFTLHFRVLESGFLRNMLQLSNRITRSEAYSTDLDVQAIALRFGKATVTRAGFELYQNQPNPFNGNTSIGFYLPEAKTATLRVWDMQGRLLLEQSQFYAAGAQSVLLENALLDAAPGLLYYELKTDTDRAVRKMVLSR